MQYIVVIEAISLSPDFIQRQVTLVFQTCQTMMCADIEVVDDEIAEGNETFSVMLERSDTLDSRIKLSTSAANLTILSDTSDSK